MGIVAEFVSSTKGVLKAGPKANATARREILGVIGALGDDLETALDVTILYLRAGTSLNDPGDLATHLDDAPRKLLCYYKEFKVCQGLYALRDELSQIFNPKRYSVNVRGFFEIPRLVRHLATGERSLLDDLSGLTQDLARAASGLRVRQAVRLRQEVKRVHRLLRTAIGELERRKGSIKTAVRRVIDTL